MKGWLFALLGFFWVVTFAVADVHAFSTDDNDTQTIQAPEVASASSSTAVVDHDIALDTLDQLEHVVPYQRLDQVVDRRALPTMQARSELRRTEHRLRQYLDKSSLKAVLVDHSDAAAHAALPRLE